MNEFKGTAGPWNIHESRTSGFCVVCEKGDPVVGCQDEYDHYGAVFKMEDAALIAASPKLFKAVNDFLNHFEGNIPLWLFEEAETAVAEALGK